MRVFLVIIAIIGCSNVFCQRGKDVSNVIVRHTKCIVLKLKKGKHITCQQTNDSCIARESGRVTDVLKLGDSVYVVEMRSGKRKIYYSGLSRFLLLKNAHVKKGTLIGFLEQDEKSRLYSLDIIVSDAKGDIAYQSLD